jgi:hypothetical protein
MKTSQLVSTTKNGHRQAEISGERRGPGSIKVARCAVTIRFGLKWRYFHLLPERKFVAE